MKKLIILFLLIAATITTKGQNQSSGDPIILNTEQTEGGLMSSCSGYVLQDGFSYKAEGDESLVLRADPELCSDEDEDDFAYNRNGCMTKDLTKGIRKIEYNALNLPQKIYIKNSKIEAIFEYNYLANGVKVRTVKRWNPGIPTAGKEVNEASLTDSLQTDYLGNKIYENGELKTILVDGGYYDCEKEKYFFYLTDHLGNNRVVADEDGNIVETNHYYPFGETFAENTKQDVQPYKYNGKELNKDLNLYDYSARHYAPSIGRFTTVDPLAEDFYSISPYAYCYNNPIKYIDPDGLAPGDPDEPIELDEVIIPGRAPQKGDITYQSNGYHLVYIGKRQQYTYGTIEHLPLPGGSFKGIISGIKSIPRAIKNIFSSSKTAGVFTKEFLSSLNKKISAQKQARHLLGKAPSGKGYLNSQADAQKVLDAVHSGEATYLGTTKTGQVVVRYNGVTGTNVNIGAGITTQPTNVFLIKGTSAPSVVPTNPLWKP